MAGKTFKDVLSEVEGKKILVANRGISARRVLRSVRERLRAVPVMTVTDVDMTCPAVAGAHELVLLGSNPRAYLDLDMVIKKAKDKGVVAIHPGWGFASEDATFPEKCEKAGLIFIGSTSRAMRTLGNKVEARRLAQKVGVPVVPGSEGAVTIPEAREIAKEIGFPIMLKAEGGGGGRGIYEVYKEEQLEAAFSKASALAQASFGNPRLFVEKLLISVHHIEIQVAADKYGAVFAFDERDCSVQRNHQKLVEITPSPWKGVTPELRERLKKYAADLVRESQYHSLATVEFLVDQDGEPYLIEVNTRLQVEHGITEARYGVDLVEEQINIAFGGKLRFNKTNTKPMLHAMQVRINCEDPIKDFAPNAGLITRYISPGGQGVRLDSCMSSGYEFPSQYDSAGALLITYGKDFTKVCATMDRALCEYIVGGLKTTIPFQRQIVRNGQFRSGDVDTKFVAKTPELLNYRDVEPEGLRLSRLVCEISAKGYNPHVMLDKYRGRDDKRVGRFTPAMPAVNFNSYIPPYPRYDRKGILDYVRDSKQVHFVDTTTRDITQSNSGNRFRLAEDELLGPYLDNCGFFSLENGGGAHFHVAMMANMTYPFLEAAAWNRFAPKTLKQILIRSTNVLGYKPQPKNLMRLTGEMICEHYDVIRCFDFLNHIENMKPFAEVALASNRNIFEPAISLSWAEGFDIRHYMGVVDEILGMVADVAGVGKRKASRMIILALKDMAGVCPPRFISKLVEAVRKKHPDLVVNYHRHFTDGLFVPAVGAAAKAGAHIVDTAMGASVRWYGQGEVLSTSSYIRDDLGVPTALTEENKDMIRSCNFVLKQIMPYYDRYTAPFFRGVDHDVVKHGMPGGATSSSQEGALKQGYITLLPYMLQFLAGTRKIVRYHDVTPGSQITWNTAFLAVTGAFKAGGERAVSDMLEVLEAVGEQPDDSKLTKAQLCDRLELYANCNDAFRNLLLGKYGRLPLGFPPDWVYESAFGADWKNAIKARTEESPLLSLGDVDINAERLALHEHLDRTPTDDELVMYLNHPADALKTIFFRAKFGNPNRLPLDVWFEGLEPGQEMRFEDSLGKPHTMSLLDISEPDQSGACIVRYVYDSEILSEQVQVAAPTGSAVSAVETADPDDPYQVASPCKGDLWVMHVGPNDPVKTGEELFNISVMKQEKAILAPVDGIVKRVLKTADFAEDRKMTPVVEGELLVELVPSSKGCPTCSEPLADADYRFCPHCGQKV